jgi:CheY-like chemotaxis protein
MVRNLVELHGGRVTARSDGENRGCEISVRIPLLAKYGGPESPTVKLFVNTGGESAAIARKKIVVVEDNADIRKMVVDILRKLGHEVWTASDGPAGVEVIVQKAPDLAIVDIGLPGFDGYEIARRIRGNPKCDAVPLIAMTGYGQPDDHRRTADAGFARHLVKPIQLDDLHEVLREFGTRPKCAQPHSAVS